MENSATLLRIGVSAAKGLVFAAFILPLSATQIPALADGIQMLPPITEVTKTYPDPGHPNLSPTTCPEGAPSVLTWDGRNPLACATGVTVTNGSVGIGTTSPAAALDVYGVIAADGSTPIKSSPPMVGEKAGWKIGLWGSNYALGIAEFSFAMETGRWFSLFPADTYPANNATTTTPDTNATINFDAVHGNGLFSGEVGIGTTSPLGNLDVEPTPAQAATNPPTPATICQNGTCTQGVNPLRIYMNTHNLSRWPTMISFTFVDAGGYNQEGVLQYTNDIISNGNVGYCVANGLFDFGGCCAYDRNGNVAQTWQGAGKSISCPSFLALDGRELD